MSDLKLPGDPRKEFNRIIGGLLRIAKSKSPHNGELDKMQRRFSALISFADDSDEVIKPCAAELFALREKIDSRDESFFLDGETEKSYENKYDCDSNVKNLIRTLKALYVGCNAEEKDLLWKRFQQLTLLSAQYLLSMQPKQVKPSAPALSN